MKNLILVAFIFLSTNTFCQHVPKSNSWRVNYSIGQQHSFTIQKTYNISEHWNGGFLLGYAKARQGLGCGFSYHHPSVFARKYSGISNLIKFGPQVNRSILNLPRVRLSMNFGYFSSISEITAVRLESIPVADWNEMHERFVYNFSNIEVKEAWTTTQTKEYKLHGILHISLDFALRLKATNIIISPVMESIGLSKPSTALQFGFEF